MKKKLGWHFISMDKIAYSDKNETILKEGKVYSIPENRKIILCKRGFHFSDTILDALYYTRRWAFRDAKILLCRVEVWGDIKRSCNFYDFFTKSVSRHKKILWMIDANDIIDKAITTEYELKPFYWGDDEFPFYGMSNLKRLNRRITSAVMAKRKKELKELI